MSIYDSNTILGEVCVAITQNLEETAGTAVPSKKRTKVGYHESLMSDINESGIEEIKYDQGNGQYREVYRDYWQRDTESDVDSFLTPACDVGRDKGAKREVLNICQAVETDIQIREIHAAALCEGLASLKEKRIQQAFNALAEKKNRLLLQTQLTNFGVNISTGSSAAVTHDFIDNAANGGIKFDVWTDFLDEVVNSNQMMGDPIIVAGSGFWKFNKTLGAGCCNDAGIDAVQMAQSQGYAFFHDQMIDSVLGANQAVVMEAGSVQESVYLKYREMRNPISDAQGSFAAFEMVNGDARGIIDDPYTGDSFNIRISWDCDSESFFIKIFQEFDAFFLPSDMYKATDTLTGYNGTLRYILT